MKNTKYLKYIGISLASLLSAMLVLTMLVNRNIGFNDAQFIFLDINTVPSRRVGLVLSTNPKLEGTPSTYYEARVQAAASLYLLKKINKIIISGNFSKKMKEDLAILGVPPEDMTADVAGRSILSAVVRTSQVYGIEDPMIISQFWQDGRALFLARHRQMKVIAFAVEDLRSSRRPVRLLGEFLARFKAGLDIWIFSKNPQVLKERKPLFEDSKTGVSSSFLLQSPL